MEDTIENVRISWSGERPHDWADWETVIRDVMREVSGGPWDVSMGYDGETWRVAGALASDGPRNDIADNRRRHRVTEALRAKAKPAGLRGDNPPRTMPVKATGTNEP